jgi:hypothetical protein
LPRRVIAPGEHPSAVVLFHRGRPPLTRGRATECSRLSRRVSSSCSDPTRFPGQKRKPHRSRQQIRAGSAYGDFPSRNSVKTLTRWRINILCLLRTYTIECCLRSLRPVGVWVILSRMLNGQETHHRPPSPGPGGRGPPTYDLLACLSRVGTNNTKSKYARLPLNPSYCIRPPRFGGCFVR